MQWTTTLQNQPTPVDILILGAVWTSTFLTRLCDDRGISHSATSRSGRESTIKFEFDPECDDLEPYRVLATASTVLITFPIDKPGGSERLVRLYTASRWQGDSNGELKPRFIQLGATNIWDVSLPSFYITPFAHSNSGTIDRVNSSSSMDRLNRLNTGGTTGIHPSSRLLEQSLRTNSYLSLLQSPRRFSIFPVCGTELDPLEIGSGSYSHQRKPSKARYTFLVSSLICVNSTSFLRVNRVVSM